MAIADDGGSFSHFFISLDSIYVLIASTVCDASASLAWLDAEATLSKQP